MSRVKLSRQSAVRLADVNHMAVSEGRIRIRISLVIFLAMICVVLVRLADVALFSPDAHLRERPAAILDMRADLTDRNGVILATTLSSFSLYAEPSRIWNPAETAAALASIRPDLNVARVTKQLASDRAFVWVDRGLSPKERQAIFDLGHPGLGFRTEPKRVYPNAPLAAHLIGWTDIDLAGAAGAERAFDKRLGADNAPELALSIDARVQHAVTEELKASIVHFSALSGAAIVMDIQTGELIAFVSAPDFNSNAFGAASPEQRFNHASMSTYDLGSVFKPLTIAMVLEDKLATRDEMFDVHKPYKVLNKFIRDDHPSSVPLNLDFVLAESSNRGTAMLAQRIGAERQQYWLRQLGLLDRVPFELAESARPQIQKNWGEMATVTVSYGHGLSVSPLALVAAIGAALNDGVYVAPTILKRHATHRPETRRVFSSAVSQDLAEMMRLTVTDGTGRKANISGFGVMGKTGTAEKPMRGGYDTDRLVTSFVAAFPHSSPRYAMIVTLDEPKAVEGTHGYATAGWNAAPTAGAIIERIGPMLPGARDVPQFAANQMEAFQ
ncbi:peptidoglycan D,D-transpeptidase FtsI family protein [Algimonas porphyrae]|uniref:Peptidoglycan glycosyltransferase n=1 Tax=Algimonas porphyrae TaxID=1128113 RepID=A0ABQ5V1F0_9PROT|nr:penicillin-binding protein 2 [Algimonas porphyrae]GLQ20062.1 peptidoglycan glycosyltransferase [Algimonas porphyrae]